MPDLDKILLNRVSYKHARKITYNRVAGDDIPDTILALNSDMKNPLTIGGLHLLGKEDYNEIRTPLFGYAK